MIFGSFDARVFQIDKVSQQWGQSRFAHRNLLSLGFVPSSGFSLPMSTQPSQPTQDDAISVITPHPTSCPSCAIGSPGFNDSVSNCPTPKTPAIRLSGT